MKFMNVVEITVLKPFMSDFQSFILFALQNKPWKANVLDGFNAKIAMSSNLGT
jgi:hypothetical protein